MMLVVIGSCPDARGVGFGARWKSLEIERRGEVEVITRRRVLLNDGG
jgi:hypothetical protein